MLSSQRSSEFVRAVRAKAGLVLQGDGVVAVVGIGFVVAELQAYEAELAVAPGQFGGVAERIEVVGDDREGIAGVRPQAVIAIADVPRAVEAIDAFQVRATALAIPQRGQRWIIGIGEDAIAVVEEILATHRDAAILEVALRRPFPGAV